LARVLPDLPDAAALRRLIDGEGRIVLRVTPRADRDALQIEGGLLKARVRAVPEDGKANASVISLLARALGVPVAQVELLRGAQAREKQFRIG